ncbi:MAG: cytochrome ubiquinol oxidase subunit I [Brooklawnia sp.]|uniref:cytochrome ubiquinol oxidase subunit I n=1 Tax=Brooklawnia sp. TaxID=2699740 RepID=UPI003C79267D
MDAQVLARWQFGITTVYHFFFVPITLGTGWLVAVMETRWLRTRDVQWLRMTRFFAKLFLINFAAGVVTGIVQEFQFGMNWSEYSRFVGDIFGAPLALEALVAFFLESTFIGIWIFGWDRLSGPVHNLMMYLTALGATISAIFILAANSWMQNPVGATYNNGRAELSDFSALFTNPFFIAAFTHQIPAAFMVSGGLLAGVAGWKLAKVAREAPAGTVHPDASIWRKTAKMGAYVLLAASVAVMGSGHYQAQVEARFQPMKLAASEGLLDTTTAAGFSIVGIYTQERDEQGITRVTEVFSWEVPYVLSILAFNHPMAEVQGINDLTEQYLTDGHRAVDGSRNQLQEEFASELATLSVDPVPNVMVSYWSFRLMMGLGFVSMGISLLILWFTRKGGTPPSNKIWQYLMGSLPFFPLFANSFGWILTEMGRQPWIVYGVLPTWTANSPNVSFEAVLTSMIAYTLIYGIIAVIVLNLFFTFIGKGLPDVTPPKVRTDDDSPLAFAY